MEDGGKYSKPQKARRGAGPPNSKEINSDQKVVGDDTSKLQDETKSEDEGLSYTEEGDPKIFSKLINDGIEGLMNMFRKNEETVNDLRKRLEEVIKQVTDNTKRDKKREKEIKVIGSDIEVLFELNLDLMGKTAGNSEDILCLKNQFRKIDDDLKAYSQVVADYFVAKKDREAVKKEEKRALDNKLDLIMQKLDLISSGSESNGSGNETDRGHGVEKKRESKKKVQHPPTSTTQVKEGVSGRNYPNYLQSGRHSPLAVQVCVERAVASKAPKAAQSGKWKVEQSGKSAKDMEIKQTSATAPRKLSEKDKAQQEDSIHKEISINSETIENSKGIEEQVEPLSASDYSSDEDESSSTNGERSKKWKIINLENVDKRDEKSPYGDKSTIMPQSYSNNAEISSIGKITMKRYFTNGFLLCICGRAILEGQFGYFPSYGSVCFSCRRFLYRVMKKINQNTSLKMDSAELLKLMEKRDPKVIIISKMFERLIIALKNGFKVEFVEVKDIKKSLRKSKGETPETSDSKKSEKVTK